MKSLKMLFMVGGLSVLLIACGSGNEASVVESDSPVADEIEGVEYTDISEIEFGDTEIDWDNIFISRADFDSFLENLIDTEPGDELVVVNSELNRGDHIVFTLNTELTEEELGEDLAMSIGFGFIVMFLDSFVRQLYIHSAHDANPTIDFINLNGDLLASNSDFLEFE